MGLPQGKFYESVGVGVASVSPTEDAEHATTVVSLVFPKEIMVRPDDPFHDDNYEDVFISIAAAKTLLIDLRDAVEAAVSGRPFE
jgi:hypothetical protein